MSTPALSVSIDTPRLRAAAEVLGSPARIVAAGAGGVARLQRSHFQTRNSEGNAKGWPSSNFFTREGVRRTSVDRASITPTSAEVVVASRQMAFRARGGTVTPKRGRYLALPATAEAYRAGSPRERGAGELVFALARHPEGGMRPALVRQFTESEGAVLLAKAQRVEGAKSAKGRDRASAALDKARAKIERLGKQLEVQYWLVRKASIPADTRILPPQMILDLEAASAAEDYIRSRIAGSTTQPTQEPSA